MNLNITEDEKGLLINAIAQQIYAIRSMRMEPRLNKFKEEEEATLLLLLDKLRGFIDGDK